MTREEIALHYLTQAAKTFPGKSKAAKEARLLAAYDMACADLEKLLSEREAKNENDPVRNV